LVLHETIRLQDQYFFGERTNLELIRSKVEGLNYVLHESPLFRKSSSEHLCNFVPSGCAAENLINLYRWSFDPAPLRAKQSLDRPRRDEQGGAARAENPVTVPAKRSDSGGGYLSFVISELCRLGRLNQHFLFRFRRFGGVALSACGTSHKGHVNCLRSQRSRAKKPRDQNNSAIPQTTPPTTAQVDNNP
jgi:hypothetical protein